MASCDEECVQVSLKSLQEIWRRWFPLKSMFRNWNAKSNLMEFKIVLQRGVMEMWVVKAHL